MPASLIVAADAITALITTHGEFAIGAVTAQRSYATDQMQLKQLHSLRVDVVPVGHSESELADRATTVYKSFFDIGVRQLFDMADADPQTGLIRNEAIDPLVELVEQLHELFCGPNTRRLNDAAVWQDTRIRACYVPEHLTEWQQFTGLVRVTYDIRKAL